MRTIGRNGLLLMLLALACAWVSCSDDVRMWICSLSNSKRVPWL